MDQLPILKKRKKEKLILSQDLSPKTPQSLSTYQKISFQRIEEELKSKDSLNQKLSLHTIQRHLSLLKLEEFLLIISFITAGVLGRILLQGFPSVEPITFFAILAGSLFG